MGCTQVQWGDVEEVNVAQGIASLQPKKQGDDSNGLQGAAWCPLPQLLTGCGQALDVRLRSISSPNATPLSARWT